MSGRGSVVPGTEPSAFVRAHMSEKSVIDLWANFLANEKLTPQRVDDPMLLVRLCEELAKRARPKIRPYTDKLKSRALVAVTAIDLGIDLAGLKHDGRMAMARSLLDIWNVEYAMKFGSAYGTAGWREDRRRKAKRKR